MPQTQRVVVFSTPTCVHCTNVKRYLKQQGIRFKDVDVSKDSRAESSSSDANMSKTLCLSARPRFFLSPVFKIFSQVLQSAGQTLIAS